ncbi:MAG TPA: FxsA family protein [Myxococcales bacterium]|nr:FxsA family protein [Myxococcales bacterium]HIN86192.1 FxsA family protein [Myxococcales bacterium]
MLIFSRLFWIFLIVSIIETMLFMYVGARIGFFPTLASVVLTAAIGAILVKREGLATLKRAEESMAQGIVPAKELVDAVLVLLAGALMLTPGFFTDMVGFLLLFPITRIPLRQQVMSALKSRTGAWQVHHQQHRPASQMEVIDESSSRSDDDGPPE